MSNPLLRRFVEKVTEKSFDQGLLWGVATGVFVTHFYKEDQYRKLLTKYCDTKFLLRLYELEKSTQ
jgi:hypothetical protein